MRKLFLFLLFFILAGISFVCQGQYTGGAEDGFSYAVNINSSCTVAVNANIYFGGVSTLSSSAALTASGCAVPVNANIYFGGVQDGFSSGILTASVCPIPVNANIYFGGVEDGSSSGVLAVSVCPTPLNSNIYFGGVEDGSSQGNLAVSVCPIPVNSNIYFGGIQDGFSSGALIPSVCPIPVNANIYFGGVQDGFSSVYLKTLLPACLLPIELSSFSGSCVGGSSVLKWSTAIENNNAFFTIEYSPDGANWQAIGTVAGAGNSSVTIDYSFTDGVSRAGTAYYQLRQTDLDGRFTYSGVISVGSCAGNGGAGSGGGGKLNVYPNPSPGLLNLSFDGDKTKIQSIEIFNVLGERVYYSAVWQSGIDLTEKGAGTYFVQVTTDTKTEVREVVLKRF